MLATTVDAATDTEREPDAAMAAEKSAVTLNYEAMLAALNDLLQRSAKRDGRPRRRAMSLMPSMARNRRPPNPNVWVEAHAALSRI